MVTFRGKTWNVSSPTLLSVFAVLYPWKRSQLISLTVDGREEEEEEREKGTRSTNASAGYLFLETSIPGCDTLLLSLRPVAR